MAKQARKQVGLNMRATLYDTWPNWRRTTADHTYVLEQAAEHYIGLLLQRRVSCVEIMAHVRGPWIEPEVLQLLAE